VNRLERHVAIPSRVNVVHGHFPEVGSKRFVIPQFIFPAEPPLIHPRVMEFALVSDVARHLAGSLIQASIYVDTLNVRQQLRDVFAMAENLSRMVASEAATIEDLRPIVAAIRERAEIPPDTEPAAADVQQEGPNENGDTPEREA
jgi:hypothetical protein